jgi:ParB family transcriptional regulator, chromosome partitioning protein
MVTKKPKGLGRGLEALLGANTAPSPESADTPSVLKVSQLQAGKYQPRTRMDEGALYELAESIKAQGVMQPILVRRIRVAPDGLTPNDEPRGPSPTAASQSGLPSVKDRYEIIAGERRFRAAQLAGLDEVPVLVRDVPDQAAAAMALIENMQREDLNPLEEAQGLARLTKEFGLTHEQASQAVGRSRSATTNLLRLLQLAEPVQTLLMAGDLDMGHARALLSLDKAAQISAANQIAARQLNVREAEALVKKLGAEFALVSPKPKTEKSRDLKRVEEELSDLLTAPVEVRIKKRVTRGSGRNKQVVEMGELSIGFGSLDELNGLIEKLRGGAA